MKKITTYKTPLRVFTAFSGYDSQCMALDILHELFPWFTYELVGYSEIDKAAIHTHDALYPKAKNYGDISNIDWSKVPDFDLFTYSSPCQDISLQGVRKGLTKNSGSRSSLLWKCEEAIKAKRPKYLLFENVNNLMTQTKPNGDEDSSPSFFESFIEWERTLQEYGYVNTWQVLNSGDYGIPQNRRRVYMVSILMDNPETTAAYYFPAPVKLNKVPEDLLEKNIKDEYYLDKRHLNEFIEVLGKQLGYSPKFVQDLKSKAIKSEHRKGHLIRQVILGKTESNLAPTILTTGFKEKRVRSFLGVSFKKPGVLEVWTSGRKNFNKPKPVTRLHSFTEIIKSLGPDDYIRIRSLTPSEALRFMGVRDNIINKMLKSGTPMGELYKQAGNSIVVDVLVHIFRKMFIDTNGPDKESKYQPGAPDTKINPQGRGIAKCMR